MGLLGNGQADVKSIEMNNRAFKKIDLNHVFVCFFFPKGMAFCLSKFWWGFHLFHVFFLWSIRPRPLPKHLSDVFYQLRWPHHNFYGRKMHCHDRSVVFFLCFGRFILKETEEEWPVVFFSLHLKHLRKCFESCPKDQRFLPLQWKGEWSCFLAGVFFDPQKTVLSSQDS